MTEVFRDGDPKIKNSATCNEVWRSAAVTTAGINGGNVLAEVEVMGSVVVGLVIGGPHEGLTPCRRLYQLQHQTEVSGIRIEGSALCRFTDR